MYKMSVSSTYLHITIKHTGSHIDKNFSTPVLGQFNHRGLLLIKYIVEPTFVKTKD